MTEEILPPYHTVTVENHALDADPNLTFKVLIDDGVSGIYEQAKQDAITEGFVHEADLGLTDPILVHLFLDEYGLSRVHDDDNKESLEQLRMLNQMMVLFQQAGLLTEETLKTLLNEASK